MSKEVSNLLAKDVDGEPRIQVLDKPIQPKIEYSPCFSFFKSSFDKERLVNCR